MEEKHSVSSKEKNTSSSVRGLRVIFEIIIPVIWGVIKVLWYIIERVILVALLLFLTVGLAWWLSQKPSHLRDWLDVDAIAPTAQINGDQVSIKNIRDTDWRSESDYTIRYRNEVYDISTLEKLSYIVTPFSDKDGPAHTMVSFSFSDGKHLVISPEIRKERGESFDALRGILNQYEIYYVLATESDVIKLRTNHRNNTVYMYPVNTSKANIQNLFRSMLFRVNKFAQEPEFYNTLWNNCSISLLSHANALRTDKIHAGIYMLLPSHSDEVLYRAGLIDTSKSLEIIREKANISEKAKTFNGKNDFSAVIRADN